jgi:hypothetical protein
MAQAKITISNAQAMKIMLLVHRKKPVYPILFDPRSGVNLRETTGNEVIEVPLGADLLNLKRFQTAGYFDVVEGTILPHVAAFNSISLNGATLSLNFGAAVTAPQLTSTADGAATDDIILKINGVATAATFAAVSAKTSISTTIDATKEDVSVQITQTGASKIKDANRSAILPATKTTSVAPIFQSITIGGTGNTTLSLKFSEPVYTAGVSSTGLGQDADDLVIIVDGTATAFTVAEITKENATESIDLTLAQAPTGEVSVKITAAGAAKILDADDTAVAGATRTYDIRATDFLTYTFAESSGTATINGLDHTVAIEVENGTEVTALVATFALSNGASAAVGATPQVSGTTANDFTSPVVYTVTAQDGTTTQNWTITVTVAAA